jgi:hypothetical protein
VVINLLNRLLRDSTRALERAFIAAVFTVFTSTAVYAQWSDVASTRSLSEREALVHSENAAELRIWLEQDHTVRMQFKLAPGLVGLSQECVTIQIDDAAMHDLSATAFECATDGDSVRLLLARAENDRINSAVLADLMNGRRVTLRYRLSQAGYGSARFSLKGSKQALGDVLSADMTVVTE